jgi:hypothetical protein
MSDIRIAEVQLPDDKPPGWANSLMKWALTTPGLQSMVGQGVALLSFEGRRTAKTYLIPVSYHQADDVVTIVTKKARKWWHNFESPIEVVLRLAGRDYIGRAQIESNADDALEFMTEYLKERPVDAKAYGLAKDARTREQIARIIPKIVVIRVQIDQHE